MARRPPRVSRLRIAGEELLVVSVPLAPATGLTEAERDIMERVAAGQTDREIAEGRGTSPRTVANQLRTLFRRVGVRSRAELVARSFGTGRPID